MPDIGDNYDMIRAQYFDAIYAAMADYLTAPAGTRITKTKLAYKRAINDAFWSAFETGYQSGGAELPLQQEPYNWILSRVRQEFDYVAGLFDRLRDEVKLTDTATGYGVEIASRADGYTNTLDGVYSMGKVFGAGNLELKFVGHSGVESCETCQRLLGQSHPASYWIKNDLVPYPGNKNLACSGYKCQHYLSDRFGNMFTL